MAIGGVRYVRGSICLTKTLIIAFLVSSATFLAGWFLAARVLRRATALAEAAYAIARSGQVSERVHVGESRAELERLAEAFNEMLGRLEQTQSVQQRFISDASHELRAPLTVVQGNLEILLRHTVTDADRRDAVREAYSEAGRLGRLVAALLALANSDAGVLAQRIPVELDRVLLGVLGEARHLGSANHIEVELLEPVTVRGDPDRLKQLFLILVDNAVKYNLPDGPVVVTLRRIQDLAGEPRVMAEVCIRDSGIGIPSEEITRVFDRFYRGVGARARDPGGTGLGLPIARGVATQHGGTVTLSSEPGRGTVATVRLPIV